MNDRAPPLHEQARFWDEWNQRWRGGDALDGFMERQRQVAAEVARRLGLRGGRILDVGCGTGWLGYTLREWGQITGVDLSHAAIERGRALHPGIRLVCGDFDVELGLGGGYDLVVSADALAHVSDQAAFVERVAALLRLGGTFLLMTQNPFVWNRTSSLAPRGEGQLRDWPSRQRLRRLLAPRFDVRRMTTIVPGGDRGLLRVSGNRYLRAVARRTVGECAWNLALERLGAGRELVVEAVLARGPARPPHAER